MKNTLIEDVRFDRAELLDLKPKDAKKHSIFHLEIDSRKFIDTVKQTAHSRVRRTRKSTAQDESTSTLARNLKR